MITSSLYVNSLLGDSTNTDNNNSTYSSNVTDDSNSLSDNDSFEKVNYLESLCSRDMRTLAGSLSPRCSLADRPVLRALPAGRHPGRGSGRLGPHHAEASQCWIRLHL